LSWTGFGFPVERLVLVNGLTAGTNISPTFDEKLRLSRYWHIDLEAPNLDTVFAEMSFSDPEIDRGSVSEAQLDELLFLSEAGRCCGL
jgi:hypothetical protein